MKKTVCILISMAVAQPSFAAGNSTYATTDSINAAIAATEKDVRAQVLETTEEISLVLADLHALQKQIREVQANADQFSKDRYFNFYMGATLALMAGSVRNLEAGADILRINKTVFRTIGNLGFVVAGLSGIAGVKKHYMLIVELEKLEKLKEAVSQLINQLSEQQLKLIEELKVL